MNDTDFLKMVWQEYEEALAQLDNKDYLINVPQMKKYREAYEFFKRVAEDCDGRIEPRKLEPKEASGGITVYMTLLYLSGDDLIKFSEIVGSMSAISIDSMIDGDICISFNIPDVFKRKG